MKLKSTTAMAGAIFAMGLMSGPEALASKQTDDAVKSSCWGCFKSTVREIEKDAPVIIATGEKILNDLPENLEKVNEVLEKVNTTVVATNDAVNNIKDTADQIGQNAGKIGKKKGLVAAHSSDEEFKQQPSNQEVMEKLTSIEKLLLQQQGVTTTTISMQQADTSSEVKEEKKSHHRKHKGKHTDTGSVNPFLDNPTTSVTSRSTKDTEEKKERKVPVLKIRSSDEEDKL